MSDTKLIDPGQTFLGFLFFTTLYFGIKYFISERFNQKSNKTMGKAITFGYLVIILLMQFLINMSNAKRHCGGDPQLVPALLYTIIPNLLMFGGLILAIFINPGWKEPFSNTIGYLIVGWLGVKETFNKILKNSGQNKLLAMVTEDPGIMINEITPENFDLFLSKMGGKDGGMDSLPIAEAVPADKPPEASMKGGRRRYKQKGGGPSILSSKWKDHEAELYNLVVVKDKISEFIWYLLTGGLVIQNSYNWIININCKRDPKKLAGTLSNNLNNIKEKEKPKEYPIVD